MRTDKQRIDWLEKQFGIGLISDDNGHWTIPNGGFQNAVCGKKPQFVESTFWVEPKEWKTTVRKAIDTAMDE